MARPPITHKSAIVSEVTAAVAIMSLGLECHAVLPTPDSLAKRDIGMKQIIFNPRQYF
jgi:hypothetical protein